MSSTHNHCFPHHHYQAWCHQIFFVNNTKIFVTSSVLKLQKWFLHQNGVEFNKKSKSDMYKLLGGAWRCVSYQKMCSRWLLAWYRHLAWLDIVAHCALPYFCIWGLSNWRTYITTYWAAFAAKNYGEVRRTKGSHVRLSFHKIISYNSGLQQHNGYRIK